MRRTRRAIPMLGYLLETNQDLKSSDWKSWWDWLDLNQRPIGYEPTALTTELQSHKHLPEYGKASTV